MRIIERYVQSLDIPAEIVWGMNDPILGHLLPLMKRSFPGAPVTETEGGHFLQEEVPAEIAAALLRVIDQIQVSRKWGMSQNPSRLRKERDAAPDDRSR
jgi:haloalkane dehalogenase